MQATLKPTLIQLLNRHHINMIRLAQVAGISVEVVRAIALHHPVQPIVAQQVLYGLYRLTYVSYQLENLDIALIPPSYVISSFLL